MDVADWYQCTNKYVRWHSAILVSDIIGLSHSFWLHPVTPSHISQAFDLANMSMRHFFLIDFSTLHEDFCYCSAIQQ